MNHICGFTFIIFYILLHTRFKGSILCEIHFTSVFSYDAPSMLLFLDLTTFLLLCYFKGPISYSIHFVVVLLQ